jgi:hypothetical protein
VVEGAAGVSHEVASEEARMGRVNLVNPAEQNF